MKERIKEMVILFRVQNMQEYFDCGSKKSFEMLLNPIYHGNLFHSIMWPFIVGMHFFS